MTTKPLQPRWAQRAEQCCTKCKILARLTDHLWLMVGWSVSVMGILPINNLLRPCNQSKNYQNGPNGVLRHSAQLISVHLWNCLPTFVSKHFLQNLKNPLVAKRTIYGRTLGRLAGGVMGRIWRPGDRISAALGWGVKRAWGMWKRSLSLISSLCIFPTRTTRTPAFWGYPPPPRDYPYYWPVHFESQVHTIDQFISDPKSKEGESRKN